MANTLVLKENNIHTAEYKEGQCFKVKFSSKYFIIMVVQEDYGKFQLIDIVSGNRWDGTRFDSVEEAVIFLCSYPGVSNVSSVDINIVEV